MAAPEGGHKLKMCSFCSASLLSILFLYLLFRISNTSIISLTRAAMQLHPADVFKPQPGRSGHSLIADLSPTLLPPDVEVPLGSSLPLRANPPHPSVSNPSWLAADQAAGDYQDQEAHQLESPPTCRSADGAPVDWFVVLKLPNGDHYAYIDSTFSPPQPCATGPAGGYKWAIAAGLAAQGEGPLAKTLLPLYANQVNTSYVMYSDEYPDITGQPAHCWGWGAHAKGVLGFGPQRGFWLTHSIPKTPSHPHDGPYRGIHPPQLKYGQSMLCVSLDQEQLDLVGRVLGTSGVWVYAARLAAASQALYPHVQRLISFGPHRMARSSKAPPWVRGQIVRSLGGQSFALFAKRPTVYKWPIWLYEQLVEPFFALPMAWETWQNGEAAPQPSGCNGTRFPSFTVKQVAVPEAEMAAPMWSWGVHADHSKWGVPFDVTADQHSASPSGLSAGLFRVAPPVCLSDMNRQMSQGRRGGGAACFLDNRAIFESFRKLIVEVESCSQAGEGRYWFGLRSFMMFRWYVPCVTQAPMSIRRCRSSSTLVLKSLWKDALVVDFLCTYVVACY
ncbi:hypothetical protein KFL_006170080 [Klebsormidium nitens]|uniref:Uncharacterized protein n=1 Tax=Klebsormidium nitens TaxID=105231 RepID=A0A1Y1IH96_KLENI|nr:hypothetical protein KFL_006170080 [Klebsormidium nitens]|eukprot:GAQ90240.1 hypothetical protein KFL_006170080 [Klebsormidium nitens]